MMRLPSVSNITAVSPVANIAAQGLIRTARVRNGPLPPPGVVMLVSCAYQSWCCSFQVSTSRSASAWDLALP